MGVRGLQTFMERSSGVASEVNIKDLVDEYRRETSKDPVIVVDGSSCLRPLYGELDWICGGQVREFVEKFINFIKAFEVIGVKLVFFFDGPTQEEKRGVWVQRRYKSLDDAYQVFGCIRNSKGFFQLPSQTVMLPPATSYLASHAIMVYNSCEIHRSVEECDKEIVKYALQHDCFAILAQDSDYVIYDGPQYYLSASNLNVEKMTTLNYNRWELARRLHLNHRLLPVFASLVGNDILRSDDLEMFHKSICGPKYKNFKDIICKVAEFILRNITDVDRLDDSLLLISKKIFLNEQKSLKLELSVKSYGVSTNADSQHDTLEIDTESRNDQKLWKNIQNHAEIRFKNGDLDSMIYAVMHGLPYESSTSLEDFRVTDIPASAAVFRPLRQRIYGIILHEMPGDPEGHVVQEWCMEGPRSLEEPKRVPITSPHTDSHPGLLTLWNEEDTSADLLTQKWVLLANAVSSQLDPDVLKSVPTTLLAPTLLLFYLHNEISTKFLEPLEIDAFIATAVMLKTYSLSSLAEIVISRANPRAVQLACILGRGSSIIKMLIDACGRPVPQTQVSAWHYFDGKLFQTMYQKILLGSRPIDLCKHQVSQIEQFNHIRSIIFPASD